MSEYRKGVFGFEIYKHIKRGFRRQCFISFQSVGQPLCNTITRTYKNKAQNNILHLLIFIEQLSFFI